MFLYLIVIKDNLKGGVVLKNKKNIGCFVFLFIICLDFCLLFFFLNLNCEWVINEFVGNFFIINNIIFFVKDVL